MTKAKDQLRGQGRPEGTLDLMAFALIINKESKKASNKKREYSRKPLINIEAKQI